MPHGVMFATIVSTKTPGRADCEQQLPVQQPATSSRRTDATWAASDANLCPALWHQVATDDESESGQR
eukprot:14217727-Heterocapsa_arctica.AAC.1